LAPYFLAITPESIAPIARSVLAIEYKKVLQEEQMRKLQQKIADMQRDY
jgi:hypothetical protein